MEKNTYFKSDHCKFIENINNAEGILLNSTNDSLDPFDYHLGKCGENASKTIENIQIHSFYPYEEHEEDDEEEDIWRAHGKSNDWVQKYRNSDKPAYCHGNKQTVKVFNQKCVICFENHSVIAFCQCGL